MMLSDTALGLVSMIAIAVIPFGFFLLLLRERSSRPANFTGLERWVFKPLMWAARAFAAALLAFDGYQWLQRAWRMQNWPLIILLGLASVIAVASWLVPDKVLTNLRRRASGRMKRRMGIAL
ncbi:hypothetical protein [Phenylobacterium montanum]|uniref:Uncharacterized protein n=1 Tax=Phenylobacterium montanum TaxID=2823693 RepID=A0A975ITJ2_9CAUL|nr:hypothetical protein [Caulobacter sp. S6]QUD86790.1 hypothetical protein KCG34_17150 [Caulobacter sp. S6]